MAVIPGHVAPQRAVPTLDDDGHGPWSDVRPRRHRRPTLPQGITRAGDMVYGRER